MYVKVNKGYSSLTLYYTPDDKQWEDGGMRTISCTANWVSGARKDFGNTWDLKKFPDGVRQTLQRPNVAGYEKDAQFALQVQNMKYQQRQAAAADEAYQQRRNINNYLRYGY